MSVSEKESDTEKNKEAKGKGERVVMQLIGNMIEWLLQMLQWEREVEGSASVPYRLQSSLQLMTQQHRTKQTTQ